MTTFRSRWQMAVELFPRGGVIAEIGVQAGKFAGHIWRECEPSCLVLVDPWRYLAGPYEADPANRGDEARELEFRQCMALFQNAHGVVVYRMLSSEAAPKLADGFFDAVYLDADHTREGITADLALWWPKVKAGGILAGHDYTVTPWIAVRPVVDAFVAEHGLELMLTEEPDWPSWAVRKP